MAVLSIAAEGLESIRAQAKGGAPLEICGILVGRRVGEDIVVERVVATANAHPNPRTEYLVPPEELLRVSLEAEDQLGLEVVGFYHSHPAGPARLSATDHARASWPGAAYLLIWLAPQEGVGAWTWKEEARNFEPRELVIH